MSGPAGPGGPAGPRGPAGQNGLVGPASAFVLIAATAAGVSKSKVTVSYVVNYASNVTLSVTCAEVESDDHGLHEDGRQRRSSDCGLEQEAARQANRKGRYKLAVAATADSKKTARRNLTVKLAPAPAPQR